jgi:hypothetical protein
MALVSFIQTDLFFGTINDSASSNSLQHNFGPSTVLSYPELQSVGVNSDNGGVNLTVSQFVDNNGAHNASFHPGIFATNCTSVTCNISTTDCLVNTILTTWFWE